MRGLSRALEGRPELEILPLGFDGHGPRGDRRPRPRLVSVRIAHERAISDVLHCTTMRGPAARAAARRRHGPRLRPPAAPGGVPAVAPAHGPVGPAPRRSSTADAVVAVSAFTRDELVELLGRPRRAGPRRPQRDRPRLHRGRGRGRGRLRARGRHARAAQEPRPGRRGGAARGRRAAGRRSAGLGRSRGTGLGRDASTTTSSRRSTAARAASSSRRSTRASGCRCSRRWPAARRS